ncbi:MAG TPA: sigma 54-interacting transcriptional regulator [Kofleriaceae bacterium]|nr:sigma 54-interacting transcriptional regulator [Kofleriaceae bacterium]
MDPSTLPPSTYDPGDGRSGRKHVPGVVVVFSGGVPRAQVMTLASGPLEIGRSDTGLGKLEDGRVSRRHAKLAFEDGRCVVTDLGSQNGTFVDGELAPAHMPTPAQRVIRIGDSLLVPYDDVTPFERMGVRTIDGFVRGPEMQTVLEEAAHAARSGTTLHVRGENGTGKEGVVHAFHRAGPRAAKPLVPVNCAAIPHAIAERLLFGAKRGAYSGAEADAAGYIQEAEGSTLFLDEIAELDLQVQAKLLRVLESKELLPLGAAKPRKVDFALCSATNKDLRALVAAGTLREDLYFRVGRPTVTAPALRNRPEEIPAMIARELAALSPVPTMHVSLIEQCLLRPWPGNVRELLAEIRIAAQAAQASGNRVEARHLSATAGSAFGPAMPESRPTAPEQHAGPPSDGTRKRTPQVDLEWRRRIEDALRANTGNIAATARALGLHRTQLRRLIERHGITVAAVAGDGDDEVTD